MKTLPRGTELDVAVAKALGHETRVLKYAGGSHWEIRRAGKRRAADWEPVPDYSTSWFWLGEMVAWVTEHGYWADMGYARVVGDVTEWAISLPCCGEPRTTRADDLRHALALAIVAVAEKETKP